MRDPQGGFLNVPNLAPADCENPSSYYLDRCPVIEVQKRHYPPWLWRLPAEAVNNFHRSRWLWPGGHCDQPRKWTEGCQELEGLLSRQGFIQDKDLALQQTLVGVGTVLKDMLESGR